MVRLKKFLSLVVLLLSLACLLDAQTATVKRNVNLRSVPSTKNNDPIALLKAPTVLGVRDLDPTNGYFEVITADDTKGWVWGRNIEIDPDGDFHPATSVPAYNRDDWKHWIDEDGDCQNTRNEVLARDSEAPVTFKSRSDGKKCVVKSGQWRDPYTGQMFTDPKDLDIDHVVPLQNAHISGGWKWDKDVKKKYANYLADPKHLLAVSYSANRQKGEQAPDDWKPKDEAFWCAYATEWEKVKKDWTLTMTPSEAGAVKEMEQRCK